MIIYVKPEYNTKEKVKEIANKIKEHKLRNNPLKAIEPGETVELGNFDVTAFRIGHSIPDAMAIPRESLSW